MIHVERGHGARVAVAVLDGESLVDADELPVVTLTDWTGATVAAPEATQVLDGGDPVTGRYQFVFPAQGDLGAFTATAALEVGDVPRQIVTEIEVVGGHYFELPALRAMPDLGNVDRYSTDDLAAARQRVTARIDGKVGTSFVERFHVESGPRRAVRYPGGYAIQVDDRYPRTVVAVSIDDTTVDVETLTVAEGGFIVSPTPWPTGLRMTIAYTAGWSTSTPEDLAGAALKAARHQLVSSRNTGVSDRTRSLTTPEGTQVFSVAGENAPFGIPDADAIVMDYWRRLRPPAFA